MTFQIGSNTAQSINVDFGTFAMTADTGNDFEQISKQIDFSTNANANTAMGYIDTAITAVTTRDGTTLGAAISRLELQLITSNNAVQYGSI